VRILYGVCAALALLLAAPNAPAEVCNVKVVTDASPDYSDMPSLVRSVTSKWGLPEEKCWAMFYWNHIARRQTAPMSLHGMDLADPIRQFNDYGFTMCSTICAINCGIWHHMGLKAKYWDISMHTVPEVEYNGRWHMYDNSMSALYTLCDGKTIAGVADIGKEGACEASGGKVEMGHVAKYHCLYATGPRGCLQGADCERSLEDEAHCFNPKSLQYRTYYYDWDFGHRYILNLKEGEVYTRHTKSLGDGAEFFVPNADGKDPEQVGKYGQRGNGVWSFRPALRAADYAKVLHSSDHMAAVSPEGLHPDKAATPAWAIFKVQAANVITSQTIDASFTHKTMDDVAKVSVSTSNGLKWQEVWKADALGGAPAKIKLGKEVNGAYEVLVKVELLGKASPDDAILKALSIETRTQVNAKTQPRLSLGKNTVYVAAGDPTESIVFWPELQADKYKDLIVEEKNIACDKKHIGYNGVLWSSVAKEDGYLVYRMDAPGDIAHATYGGRFYNRFPGSRCEIAHSVDGGKTWTNTWKLTSVEQPWDVIHYETVDIPKGHKTVWVRYLMNAPNIGRDACSIYALRLEADYAPADTTPKPVEVTFNWSEVQKDRSLVKRSHTERVAKLPARYTIDTGGEDLPIVNSLAVSLAGAVADSKPGYSDGKDAGGGKFVGRWVTYGKNLAMGKPYTVSVPPDGGWGGTDPEGKKLTDGAAGPPYAGGTSYKWGACWNGNRNPVVTVDLGEAKPCASFGMNIHGYMWWDSLKGENQDKVEVLVSKDGKEYAPVGFLKMNYLWKELPVNHMWPDHELIQGDTFRVIPDKPVEARFVQYKVTSSRFFDCTELEVLDLIQYKPFDLKLALPDEKVAEGK